MDNAVKRKGRISKIVLSVEKNFLFLIVREIELQVVVGSVEM